VIVVVASLSARKAAMAITFFVFIEAVVCAYLLGISTVFAILVWVFDRNHHNDSFQDNLDKVFLLRLIMWLPLIGAGLMAMKVAEEFISRMEI
jgi:hypothetical protein